MTSEELRCSVNGCIFTDRSKVNIVNHIQQYHGDKTWKYCFFCGFCSLKFEDVLKHKCPLVEDLRKETKRVNKIIKYNEVSGPTKRRSADVSLKNKGRRDSSENSTSRSNCGQADSDTELEDLNDANFDPVNLKSGERVQHDRRESGSANLKIKSSADQFRTSFHRTKSSLGHKVYKPSKTMKLINQASSDSDAMVDKSPKKRSSKIAKSGDKKSRKMKLSERNLRSNKKVASRENSTKQDEENKKTKILFHLLEEQLAEAGC